MRERPHEDEAAAGDGAAALDVDPRPRSLWRNADFLKLWGGETLSQIGAQVSVLALPLTAIITLQASPQQVGFLTAAQYAPWLVVTLFVGVWLDTHRRRPALLAANVGRFVLIGLIPLLYETGGLTMTVLYVIAFLAGTLSAVFDVAYLVYLPSLVHRDQLVEANARLEATYSVALIGGPGLGGILVQLFTAPLAVLANAITYAVGAVSVAWIRRPEPEPEPAPRTSMVAEIKRGLATTFRHPLLRPLALVAGWFNLFEQAALTLTLLFAVRTLHLPSGLIGTILATGAVGGLCGTFVAARVGRRLGTGWTLVGGLTLASIGFVLVPAASGGKIVAALILVAGLLLYGFGSALFNVHSLSLRIAAAPSDLLARVTATYRFVIYGAIPLGALLGGFLGKTLGFRTGLVVVVTGLLAVSLALGFTKVRTVTSTAGPGALS